MGVMHDHDALDAEQVLRDRHRPQRVDGTTARDDHFEQRCRRRHLPPIVVGDDFAGEDVAERLGNGGGDPNGTGVVAVDDDGPQRHRLGELPPNGLLVVAGLFREHVRVEVASRSNHRLSPFGTLGGRDRSFAFLNVPDCRPAASV